MNSLIQAKTTRTLFIALALLCFASLPKAEAVVPPPDGGYPNFTTAEGTKALQSLTTGAANTAVGWYSLFSETQGSFNTATGAGTLLFNAADANTAFGTAALLFNTIGNNNTAVGAAALLNNTQGDQNTASGADALRSNISGDSHTANGFGALRSNTTGHNNTAVGASALGNNVNGGGNAAFGGIALFNNTSGGGNTALGAGAGLNITGNGNVCIGVDVFGEAGVDDSTYIRNVNTLTQNFSAGVNNYVTVRLSDGRLGHTAVVSSQRYKQDIKPLAATSHALYALKPVSFRLKKEFDPTQALGFGLIAEEVEKVDPALVYRNAKGQVESVRYEMVNAMLLNEFLIEHKKVEEKQAAIEQLKSNAAKQEATISELRKDVGVLTAQLKEQAAQIQKVNARIEANELTPQLVSNGQ
jgi:Chaperone of endosialidase